MSLTTTAGITIEVHLGPEQWAAALRAEAGDVRRHLACVPAGGRRLSSAKFRRRRVAAELAAAALSMTRWSTDPAGDYALSMAAR
jgi:uncharacterized SAM-dependent methyltransferase